MNAMLWRHEARRTGWPALAPPVVVAAAVVALAVVMVARSASYDTVVRWLVAGLEVAVPLACGIGAADLIGRDPAVELQLSVPVSYRATVLRRLAVTVAWPMMLAAAGTVVLVGVGWWPTDRSGAASLFVWLAPLLWLAGLGSFAAVLFRSGTAASGLVAGVWFVEQMFAGEFADSAVLRAVYLFPTTWLPGLSGWWINRVVLLGTAAMLFGAVWLLLSRPHRLLNGAES